MFSLPVRENVVVLSSMEVGVSGVRIHTYHLGGGKCGHCYTGSYSSHHDGICVNSWMDQMASSYYLPRVKKNALNNDAVEVFFTVLEELVKIHGRGTERKFRV